MPSPRLPNDGRARAPELLREVTVVAGNLCNQRTHCLEPFESNWIEPQQDVLPFLRRLAQFGRNPSDRFDLRPPRETPTRRRPHRPALLPKIKPREASTIRPSAAASAASVPRSHSPALAPSLCACAFPLRLRLRPRTKPEPPATCDERSEANSPGPHSTRRLWSGAPRHVLCSALTKALTAEDRS
jgi:hypothetical protein